MNNKAIHAMFSCVFVIFPHGVPGQVWYLIVSIPDICLHLYFVLFGIYIQYVQMMHGFLLIAVSVFFFDISAIFL